MPAAELDQRHDEHDKKQRVGNRAAVTHLEEAETRLVHIENDRKRGPMRAPCVIMKACPNIWKLPIRPITTLKSVVGRRRGHVIAQNRLQGVAPSTSAAS